MTDHDDAPDDGGPDDEELAEMADDLSDVLRDLRDELRASREGRGMEPVEQPSNSSGGGVADFSIDLPSATDVLAFTDEKLIPAAITILEVNIKALELLQKGIRWARPDRAGENARAVQSHAESVSRSTLQRLDTVLADLQTAASDGSLPENAEASGIITEARGLRDEIDAALAARAEARDEEGELDELPSDDVDDSGDDADADEDAGSSGPWGDQSEVDVDVEGELQSIKAELGKEDDDKTTIDDDVPEEDVADQNGADRDADRVDTDRDDTDQVDGEQDADRTDSQAIEESDDPPAGDDSSSEADDDGSATDVTDEVSGGDADDDEPSEDDTAASDSEESVDDS